jgi:hypothetical protein
MKTPPHHTSDADRKGPTVEQFLRPFPESVREIVSELRALIRKTIPDIREAVYPGWKLIGYRVVENKRDAYFCFLAPAEDRVFLGFEYGALLSDPDRLLMGDTKQVRHVVIVRKNDILPEKLSRLITEGAMTALTVRKR